MGLLRWGLKLVGEEVEEELLAWSESLRPRYEQRSQLSGRKAWPGGPDRPAETPGRPGRPVWRTPRPNIVLDLAIYSVACDACAPFSNSLPRVPAL
jgi:hypothetical protein